MFESPEYLHSEISNPLSLNIKSFNFMVDFIREMHFANIVYFCVINIFFCHFIFCDKHDTGILIARVPSLHDSYREFAGCDGPCVSVTRLCEV